MTKEFQTLKPLVFDKENHIKNFWNWSLEDNTFKEFEYYGDDEDSQLLEEEAHFNIKGLGDVYVYYEIFHEWHIECDSGDYYTPPSITLVHEDIEVEVLDIHFDFDVTLPTNILDDIKNRLGYLLDDLISTI
jgi:hypothetical protein